VNVDFVYLSPRAEFADDTDSATRNAIHGAGEVALTVVETDLGTPHESGHRISLAARHTAIDHVESDVAARLLATRAITVGIVIVLGHGAEVDLVERVTLLHLVLEDVPRDPERDHDPDDTDHETDDVELTHRGVSCLVKV